MMQATSLFLSSLKKGENLEFVWGKIFFKGLKEGGMKIPGLLTLKSCAESKGLLSLIPFVGNPKLLQWLSRFKLFTRPVSP